MNTALWVMQYILAAFFIMPGIGKLSGTVQKHIADGHLKPGTSIVPIRLLGILELMGCIGIIIPWLTGIVPILTPITALGFCLVMGAGLINHTRKKEYKMLPMLVVVLIMAILVAYYRSGFITTP